MIINQIIQIYKLEYKIPLMNEIRRMENKLEEKRKKDIRNID